MGEIVNLKRARNRRDRDEKAAKAAENRAKFGQPKAATDKARALADKAERTLDGHKLIND